MHHALLEGRLPDLDSFEKRHFRVSDELHVVLLEAYRGLGEDDELVFVAAVDEPGLRQDVLVGVKRFGSPLITRGTSEAVRLVSEWLEGQGMRIVRRQF